MGTSQARGGWRGLNLQERIWVACGSWWVPGLRNHREWKRAGDPGAIRELDIGRWRRLRLVLKSPRSRVILGPLDILVDIGVPAEKEVIQ